MLATSPVQLGLSALGFDIATLRQSFHLMFVLIRSLKYLEMLGEEVPCSSCGHFKLEVRFDSDPSVSSWIHRELAHNTVPRSRRLG